MLQTTRVLEQIADRIERAYLHRRPEWRAASLDRRLWSSAAAVLINAHALDDQVPLDPELFVACQVKAGMTSDPWMDLTRPGARRRYLGRVRRIVRSLRREIRGEIRVAEAAVRKGESLEVVLLAPSRRLTALSRYLTAIRHDRRDLADRFRDEARDQHRACPLYRAASGDLVPLDDYPVIDIVPELSHSPGAKSFSLN